MRIALEESKKALPNCMPNPPVGCVLVKDGKVVSKGHTKPPGNNHAEIDAIKKYSGSLNEVTAYITLEPCSFEGRTPSCAQTLVKENIKSVFIAIRDPHPKNRGAGINILNEAGVQVQENILADEVLNFIKPYLST